MFGLDPVKVLTVLAILIWIDGLLLCAAILWKPKPKPKGGAQTVAAEEPKVAEETDLSSQLGYIDPLASGEM